MKNIGPASVLVALILLAGGLAWPGVSHAGQPLDCAAEDRVVPGNTNSDCKWDYGMDTITGVRFVVLEREGADACYGALEFHPYNFVEDLAPDGVPRRDAAYLQATIADVLTGQPVDLRPGQPPAAYDVSDAIFGAQRPGFTILVEGDASSLRVIGDIYDLASPVTAWGWFPDPQYQYARVKARGGLGAGVHLYSPWFPIPAEVNDFPVMLNACLAGVKLRLETEQQLEENRAKLAAQELARQQALAEEQAKAALDAERLAAAQWALKIQQEIELTKTRSLIARLERDKIIIAVWNDIVLERLRGFQERAEITNRYLAEVEANAADFSARVREKYEELQRLEELNEAIADSIAAHNREIEAQLAAAAELEAHNLEKLEDLAVTPRTPAPTPGG